MWMQGMRSWPINPRDADGRQAGHHHAHLQAMEQPTLYNGCVWPYPHLEYCLILPLVLPCNETLDAWQGWRV